MTVQDLIDRLSIIKGKDKQVILSIYSDTGNRTYELKSIGDEAMNVYLRYYPPSDREL